MGVGRKRLHDPNFQETSLFPGRRGRPARGYKLITGPSAASAINVRKGRGVWSTQAENEFLKMVLNRIKAGDTAITIADLLNAYIAAHNDISIISVGDPPETWP